MDENQIALCTPLALQMEATRAVARRLVAEGRLEILQKGQVVDPHTFKGPIRLRLRQPAAAAEGQQVAGDESDEKESGEVKRGSCQ